MPLDDHIVVVTAADAKLNGKVAAKSSPRKSGAADEAARQARHELILRIKREVMQKPRAGKALSPERRLDAASQAACKELIALARLKALSLLREESITRVRCLAREDDDDDEEDLDLGFRG
jgi:hypothetical protein